jgi:hypothetical protein
MTRTEAKDAAWRTSRRDRAGLATDRSSRGIPAHYFENTQTNCATAGSIALTVVVGPLNYVGVNPKVKDCSLPQPSS